MYYLLTFLSILLETSKNIFSNNFSKNVLKNETDIYKFNACMYLGSFIVLLPMLKTLDISMYSVIMAVFFAIVTTAGQYFYLKALNNGSMSYSTFFQGCGLIIPTICGILFWGEVPKITQYIALPLLIIAMGLALLSDKIKFSKKWLFFSVMTSVFTGFIGVFQSIHQSSDYSGELIEFLILSFLFMVILNFVVYIIFDIKVEKSTFKLKSNAIIMALASGIFMGIVNVLNLYLAGKMNKVIFFPLVNGGLIFVSLIAALIIFKEKLTKIQLLGMILGIAALCLISI